MTELSPLPRSFDTTGLPAAYPVHEHEVQALIVAAQAHPLGMAFLTEGHLAAVAITFQVHAFTVDAARRVLRGE